MVSPRIARSRPAGLSPVPRGAGPLVIRGTEQNVVLLHSWYVSSARLGERDKAPMFGPIPQGSIALMDRSK